MAIQVYNLDAFGVVVDTTNATGSNPAELTKAQNAIADPLGEQGTISNRPGLKPLQTVAADGAVRGGIGVPVALGSAGPNFGNPFTDLTVTVASWTNPVTSTQRLGATFDDGSHWFDWDWLTDFGEDEELSSDFDVFEQVRFNGISGQIESSTTVPLTLFGDVTGFWFVSLSADLAQRTDSGTTYPSTKSLITPQGSVRAYNASGSGTGGSQDANYPLHGWYGATPSSREDGYPVCMLNGVMYYVGGYTDYTVGTTAPVLRAFDGFTDRIVLRLPKNPDVSATAVSKAIVSLLAANNKVYLSTFDGGTGGASGGTVKGSVYEFDPNNRTVTKLGDTFPTGHLPYSLTYAYGRLWCGTAINNLNDATPGRVYWIRPGTDTAWTLDKTFSAHEAMVMALTTFQGQLYAAVDWNSTGAGTSALYVRSTLGVWSTADTVSIGVDATGVSRGYAGLTVFPREDGAVAIPAPALYVIRRNGTGDANTGAIRKYTGSAWSTVYTFDFTSNGNDGLDVTYAISNAALRPVLWLTHGLIGASSTDGTTWVNHAANFTTTAAGMGFTAGFGGLVIQV